MAWARSSTTPYPFYVAISREIALYRRPKVREPPDLRRSRGSGDQRLGYKPTRVLHAHATVPSSSGPARKHTAKFEPAAWSWALGHRHWANTSLRALRAVAPLSYQD